MGIKLHFQRMLHRLQTTYISKSKDFLIDGVISWEVKFQRSPISKLFPPLHRGRITSPFSSWDDRVRLSRRGQDVQTDCRTARAPVCQLFIFICIFIKPRAPISVINESGHFVPETHFTPSSSSSSSCVGLAAPSLGPPLDSTCFQCKCCEPLSVLVHGPKGTIYIGYKYAIT